MDWAIVDESIYEPPKTYEEMIELDRKHHNIGLGQLWMVSKRRAELIKDIRGRGNMHEIIAPELIKNFEGQRVPLTIYREGDARGEVVGEAILHVTEEGVVQANTVSIRGDAALEILQNGTRAFSLGFAPPDIAEKNEQRPPRWERRRRLKRK